MIAPPLFISANRASVETAGRAAFASSLLSNKSFSSPIGGGGGGGAPHGGAGAGADVPLTAPLEETRAGSNVADFLALFQATPVVWCCLT